MPEDWAAP